MGRYMTDIDVAVMMGEDRQQAIERILGIGWREAEFKMFTRVDEKEVNGKTALVGVGVIMLTPPPNVERDEELGIELQGERSLERELTKTLTLERSRNFGMSL